MKIKNYKNNSISFWVALVFIFAVINVSAMRTAYKLQPNRFPLNQGNAKKNLFVRIYDAKDHGNYLVVPKRDIQWSELFSNLIEDTGSNEIPLTIPSMEVVKNIFKMMNLYKTRCDLAKNALQELSLKEHIEFCNGISVLLFKTDIKAEISPEECFLWSMDNRIDRILKKFRKIRDEMRGLAEGWDKDFSSFNAPSIEGKIVEAEANLNLLKTLRLSELKKSQKLQKIVIEIEKSMQLLANSIDDSKWYLVGARDVYEESKKFFLFRKRWFR